jgi:hypothetical protein
LQVGVVLARFGVGAGGSDDRLQSNVENHHGGRHSERQSVGAWHFRCAQRIG